MCGWAFIFTGSAMHPPRASLSQTSLVIPPDVWKRVGEMFDHTREKEGLIKKIIQLPEHFCPTKRNKTTKMKGSLGTVTALSREI